MEQLATEIKEKIGEFQKELDKNVSGNKSAGIRARKASLELTALLKEYRKASVSK